MKKVLLVAGLVCVTAFGVEPANLTAAKSYLLFKAGHDRRAIELAKKACKEKDVIGCREVAIFYDKLYGTNKSNAYIMASMIYHALTAEKKGCELHDPLACKAYAKTIQSFIDDGLIAQIPKLEKGYQNPAIQGILLGQCANYYGIRACREKMPRLLNNAVSLYNEIENKEYDRKMVKYGLKLACQYAKEGFPRIKPLPASATKEEQEAYDHFIHVGENTLRKWIYNDGKCL